MTDTPKTPIALPTRCPECHNPTDDLGRCQQPSCFRYRPPDAKPIADPPKPKRLVGADRESPASGGRFPEPPASPVKVNSLGTTSRIEDAVKAAAGTVTLTGGDVLGPKGPGETLHFARLSDVFGEKGPEGIGEPVSDNPKHCAFRAVMAVLVDMRTDDARKVLEAAIAQLELN